MKRRAFFEKASLAALATTLVSPTSLFANKVASRKSSGKTAKNIIFLVSDGMSVGTLTMADLFLQHKEGRRSHWMDLYEKGLAKRALMDTSSANSLVTDSAAASSAWGGGVKVNNGMLNVNADGSFNKPILQKFKAAGKAVGCVTTVPITHATPAGFCVNNSKRSDQPGIALNYLDLKFDVMMGGGLEYFDGDKRKDKQDVFAKFKQAGFTILKDNTALTNYKVSNKPVLGVFYEDGLPYDLDRQQDKALQKQTPTLAEMTNLALNHLKGNKNGFVLQVEGGKVDWAAHANDTAALITEQIAFDDAVAVALKFAEQHEDTLIVITTDHGNANPGIFSGEDVNKKFDLLQKFKHTNDWVLNGVDKNYTKSQLIDRIVYAQGYQISNDQASQILKHYNSLDEDGVYNPRKLPFKELAIIQEKFTSVGYGSMDHSSDFVELTMLGPGSELLKPWIKNTDLHQLLLKAAEVA